MISFTQEFLAPLQREDMAYLLRNVLAMGRGSLDFAKNLQEKIAPPPPSPLRRGDTFPEWCKCNMCRPMPNEMKIFVERGWPVLQDFRHSTISALTRTSFKFASRMDVTSRQMISIFLWRVQGKLAVDSLFCGGLANSAGAIGGQCPHVQYNQ